MSPSQTDSPVNNRDALDGSARRGSPVKIHRSRSKLEAATYRGHMVGRADEGGEINAAATVFAYRASQRDGARLLETIAEVTLQSI
jgi:hypothetical protein